MRNESPPPPPGENIPIPLIPRLTPIPEFEEEIPTVRMKIPPHLLEMSRRGPNWGLIVAALFCLAFWGSVFYLFWRANG